MIISLIRVVFRPKGFTAWEAAISDASWLIFCLSVGIYFWTLDVH